MKRGFCYILTSSVYDIPEPASEWSFRVVVEKIKLNLMLKVNWRGLCLDADRNRICPNLYSVNLCSNKLYEEKFRKGVFWRLVL